MRLSSLAYLLILIPLLSCEDSDDLDDSVAFLNYDGGNESAPILEAGTNYVAVKFMENQVAQYNQGRLSEIQFFIANVPEFCQLDIYQGSANNNMPGTNIHSIDLSSEIAGPAWNRYVLAQPLTIDTEDLWITITLDHPTPLGSIGCDAGPQVTNGALVLNASETSYVSYPFANINWNIRAGFDLE